MEKEFKTIDEQIELLQNRNLHIENENIVCNMKLLINKKFKVYAIPLNFDAFDGSPCRVFAEVEQ